MVDLNEFVGDAALRKSIETKKKKIEAKLAVLIFSRIAPLEKEVAMYQEMLDAMDRAAVLPIVEKSANNIVELNQDEIPAPSTQYARL